MIAPLFDETLSIYCGGIDNLVRHHDYSLAILESIRPYPMAKYWLHCHHLHVNGKKMSKSLGNIVYLEMLTNKGFTAQEVRFFLIDGHYRRKMNYRDDRFRTSAEKLRMLRGRVRGIGRGPEGSITVRLRVSGKSSRPCSGPAWTTTCRSGRPSTAWPACSQNKTGSR